jgi:hypothetical protein
MPFYVKLDKLKLMTAKEAFSEYLEKMVISFVRLKWVIFSLIPVMSSKNDDSILLFSGGGIRISHISSIRIK